MKDTNVKITAHYRAKLDDIIKVCIDKHLPFKTKVGIIEQLIDATHKREVGK